MLDRARSIILKEAQALEETAASVGEPFRSAVELLFQCQGRIIVTGVGKAGLVGRKVSATLASTGAPSYFLHPADGLHGDLGMVMPQDVVLALSYRGQSDDVLRIIPYLKHFNVPLIAMTSNLRSELARHATIVLLLPHVEEACPMGLVPTASSTAMLALGDALAICLLEQHGFTSTQFAMLHPSGGLGKRLLLRVADVVPGDAVNPVIPASSSFKQMIIIMTSTNRGAVSVVGTDGRIVGILTDGDLKRALTRDDYSFSLPVSAIMTRNPVTTTPDTLGISALDLMEQRKTTVLPVVDANGIPLAMLNIHDLIRAGITT